MEKQEEKYIGKSKWFVFGLIFIFFMSTYTINLDVVEFIQRKEILIPDWFLYLTFVMDFLMVFSLILIYFYRKMGIYLFPLAVITHFMLQNFYLNSFLYIDLFLLFLYFSVILVSVIPRWNFFK